MVREIVALPRTLRSHYPPDKTKATWRDLPSSVLRSISVHLQNVFMTLLLFHCFTLSHLLLSSPGWVHLLWAAFLPASSPTFQRPHSHSTSQLFTWMLLLIKPTLFSKNAKAKNKQICNSVLQVKQKGSFNWNKKRENSFLSQRVSSSYSPLYPWHPEKCSQVKNVQ